MWLQQASHYCGTTESYPATPKTLVFTMDDPMKMEATINHARPVMVAVSVGEEIMSLPDLCKWLEDCNPLDIEDYKGDMLTCLPPLVTEPYAEATILEPRAGKPLAERGPITGVTVQGRVGRAPLRTAEVPVGEVAGSIAVGSGVVKELPPPPLLQSASKPCRRKRSTNWTDRRGRPDRSRPFYRTLDRETQRSDRWSQRSRCVQGGTVLDLSALYGSVRHTDRQTSGLVGSNS